MKIDINFFEYRDSIRTKEVGQIIEQMDPFQGKHKISTKDKRRKLIFDPIRNKFVALEKEELVRQLVIQYLLKEKQYPKARFGSEKEIKVVETNKRYDVLIYDQKMVPLVLVECKAPQIQFDVNYYKQSAFNQASRYHRTLQVPYLIVTNGIDTFCFKKEDKKQEYRFFDKIPSWKEIQNKNSN